MTSLISFILIISFLIFIHELGHLLAAKWANVKVEDFSIGFGPKLFSFNIGETRYSLSLLPLGGYVKMQGEDTLEKNHKDELVTLDPNRSYKNISNFKKQIILFAGPGMNLILPFILLPFIYMNGVEIPSFLKDKPIVGYVKKDFNNQFFLVGDKILEINGTKINNWEGIGNLKSRNLTSEQIIKIERNGKIKNVIFKNSNENKVFILDSIYPNQSPIIDQVLPKSVADDIEIQSWYQISEALKNTNSPNFTITIERDKSTIVKEIVFKGKERMLGITPNIELISKDFTFIDSINKGFYDSLRMIKLIFN